MTVFQLIKSDYLRIRPTFTWGGFATVLCCDETFALLFWYRIARGLRGKPAWLPLFLMSYVMLRLQNRQTGVHLSRHVDIGPGFRIEHAGKTYINKDAVFGADCTIMHSVTVGVSHSRHGKPGVPAIGDRVFIGPNAVLYGGITVGDDAMIGANSVVNKDVPAGALAAGVPAMIRLQRE
jgi:serine O-acetyltransferase